jgi:NAD(P)-dependent dehydrogenase (short-subunit alcohol dehydrogenase family)
VAACPEVIRIVSAAPLNWVLIPGERLPGRCRSPRGQARDAFRHRDAFKNKVAVVTGAGDGLGRALAAELAKRGGSLALCDVEPDTLADTTALVEAAGVPHLAARVDVTDRGAVRSFAEAVRERFGVVHQIYNNAGIALVGPVEQIDYPAFEHLMAVNFWGVVHGTKEFLPHLIESGDGHVVNISSVFGLLAVPWMACYDAAKFAVRGFTEALRAELLVTRRPVKVTCVHPGGIRTGIIRNAETAPGENPAALGSRFGRIAVSSPHGAARSVLRGVARGKPRLLVGADAYAAEFAQRVVGARYERVAAGAARWFVPSANK